MNKSIATFIEDYEAAPLTKKAYCQTLELFQRFLGSNEPTEEKVEGFMHQLEKDGLSSASINRYLSAIRAYFLWMKKKAPKELRADYDLIVRGPKVQRKLPRFLSAEEVNSVVAATSTSLERALIMVIYDGALRIGELMGVEAGDIDFADGFLKITRKGGEETRVPVSDKTLEALREHIDGHRGKVFPQPYWELHQLIRKLGNRAGVRKLTPHQLRHARASELRRQGVALEDIKDFLGHAQYETTLIYARIMPTELKRRLPSAF